ncbi:hypothetical protein [Kitasatospora sp. NPDC002965]|uniref:hypothetical protein n=1 Tax=Kitasatospora sp. NPDC002965 TaxID=3154775 RepID=UPI0033A63E87
MPADEAARDAAVQRALAFLHRALGPDGLPPALVAADRDLRAPLTGIEARRYLFAAHGADLGFEPDHEGFSAMWGLALLAPDSDRSEERELVAALARQVERYRAGHRYRCFPLGAPFPADTDSTAVALGGLVRHGLVAPHRTAAVARELLGAGQPNGLGPAAVPVPVYWHDEAAPPHGLRYDAVAAANVLHALRLPGARATLPHPAAEATLRYVRREVHGSTTRYYPSPEALFHSAARAAAVHTALLGPVRRAVVARARPLPPAPLDLALLTIAAEYAEVPDGRPEYRRRLIGAQRADGSWPARAYFRAGRLPLYFGSPHLSTLFALRALRPEQGREPR